MNELVLIGDDTPHLPKIAPRLSFSGECHDMGSVSAEFLKLRPFGGAFLIMADPPWHHKEWSARGNKRKTAQHHYQTQPLEWIHRLPLDAIAADDCLLWLWATAALLPAALGVVESWGFTYKTSGVWVKRTVTGKIANGTGRRLMTCHEPYLLATRGNPKVSKVIRSVLLTDEAQLGGLEDIGITIEAVRREHSRKPDEAFAAAAQCVDGPRVELFGREQRDGWIVWGNETEKFSNAV